ncbi:3-phosphoshikimate 1-carboxyvinyltransferase [Tannockella kyphosi]|uniref:3-phosphoshikimate 1-carboxyvinyltransferase n=1 Tax=Tannockella kyphosi TaxID=2899121 RepID=UPI002011C504|nr:3-phosphoshikimate 1-carboxyvinyltransferase [Tannockella kyphosi]
MTKLKITPRKLRGTIQVPPSKSLAHRAILCASLANGISRIDNIQYSKDIDATIKAMESLGTQIMRYHDFLIIDGTTTFKKKDSYIDCKESGSTLRFLVPISIVKENKVHFVGEGNLGKRPLHTFYEIFDRQNIDYTCQEGVLDLHIEGQLKADVYQIPGNISSQFITGLLYALPLLEQDSVIEITSPLESIGYIDLTLQMLTMFGIEIEHENYQKYYIKANQSYHAMDYTVEADFSQAAFYLVAGAIGNDVTLTNLNVKSLQGDKETLDILERMNASISHNKDGLKVTAKQLQATTIDASQCPDVIPVISLACSQAKGHTSIINAGRLRIKECDRIEATRSQLNILGANIEELEEGMEIDGVTPLHGGKTSTFDDHRIAMMLAIACTISNQPIIIDNMECVQKSYPNFWEDYQSLGGIIDECDMEE